MFVESLGNIVQKYIVRLCYSIVLNLFLIVDQISGSCSDKIIRIKEYNLQRNKVITIWRSTWFSVINDN